MKKIWSNVFWLIEQCGSSYEKTLGLMYLGYENNSGRPMTRLWVGCTLGMKTMQVDL